MLWTLLCFISGTALGVLHFWSHITKRTQRTGRTDSRMSSSKLSGRQKHLMKELPTLYELLITATSTGTDPTLALRAITRHATTLCPKLSEQLEHASKSSRVAGAESSLCLFNPLNDLLEIVNNTNDASNLNDLLRAQQDLLMESIKEQKERELRTIPLKMIPVAIIFCTPLLLAILLAPLVVACQHM